MLELDSDVEVTDLYDAESNSFHGRASDEEFWTPEHRMIWIERQWDREYFELLRHTESSMLLQIAEQDFPPQHNSAVENEESLTGHKFTTGKAGDV